MDPVILVIIIAIVGPTIGSLIGIIRMPSEGMMYNILSFAAGVMLAVSFLNLIPDSIRQSSALLCALGVAIGTLLMFAIDKLVPHVHQCATELDRTVLYLFIGIFIHNIPEGMAMGTVGTNVLSLAVALAIAIHDIPESICIAAPYHRQTGKRLTAFLISMSTIIPTLIGFFVAHFVFPELGGTAIGLIIGATAGLMIYISGHELIPSACGNGRSTVLSLIAGVLLVVILL
jgi:zinc transporter, ZIP family